MRPGSYASPVPGASFTILGRLAPGDHEGNAIGSIYVRLCPLCGSELQPVVLRPGALVRRTKARPPNGLVFACLKLGCRRVFHERP